MQTSRPFVLSIGGFDPSGGAGVLADCKVFEQLKVQGLSILTANTLQTEADFVRLQWLSIADILESISTLMRYYPVSVVKIGIVPNANVLSQILDCIYVQNPRCRVLWDPVLKTSSGFDIFDLSNINNQDWCNIMEKLYLITPNEHEYRALQYLHLIEPEPKENIPVILRKGGHRKEALGVDSLFVGQACHPIQPETEVNYEKHGSGCVLAAAIVSYLSLGRSLLASCVAAKRYTAHFLNSNTSLLGFHHE